MPGSRHTTCTGDPQSRRTTVAADWPRELWEWGRRPVRDRWRSVTMPRQVSLAVPFIGLLALPLLLAGCGRNNEDTATTQYAKDTLGVKEAGKERSVESKRQVIVEDTK